MKVSSKSIIELSIDIDENHSISYNNLNKLFDKNSFAQFEQYDDCIYVYGVTEEVCDEIFGYFFSNQMLREKDTITSNLLYDILDE
jgi:hypothetical protein